jgi:hypothetical protein
MPSQYLHILCSVTQAETVVVLGIESNFKLKPYFLNIDNYHYIAGEEGRPQILSLSCLRHSFNVLYSKELITYQN